MNAYLKVPGIRGGANEPRHAGWIVLNNFNCSLTNNAGLGGARYGQLTLEKGLDEATPALAGAVLEATTFPEIVVELHPENDVHRIMTLRFRQARIESQTLGRTTYGNETLGVAYSGFEYACEPVKKSRKKEPAFQA